MQSLESNPQPTLPGNRFARILNILTVTLLVGVFCMAGVFLTINFNPYVAFNPFPPPTLPATLALPSLTPTEISLVPPTLTPTNTLEPLPTNTSRPTYTLPPTATFFTLVTPSLTPTMTPPPGGYPYEVQKGSPYAISNLYYPEKGCDWMGVGGQVVDMSGAPVTGLIIRLGGRLPGVDLDLPLLSLTGVARNYGESGYEFTLADHPVASRGSLWLVLLDQEGLPLSEKFTFDTFDSCDKNLIVINFKQVR